MAISDHATRNLGWGIESLDAAQELVAAMGSGSGAVSSVFARVGNVVATTGDYTAAQVTNAVSTAGSYANPAWITSLAGSKISSDITTNSASINGTVTESQVVGLVTDLAAKAALASPALTGGVTITASATGTVPVVVAGLASQSADLQDWNNSASTVLASITAAGNFGLGITPTYGLHQLGGSSRLQAMATPAAPTVVVNSGSGTNYFYFIVAEDRNAYRTLASSASSSTSSSSTPNNTVSWTSVAGAVKYYVLRYTASSLPVSGTLLVATWTSGALSVTDTTATGSLGAFTTPTRNATADLTVDGTISSPGSGSLSEHFGASSTSAGSSSVAVGQAASAALANSVAIGQGAIASGQGSTVVGSTASTSAGGYYATAVGEGTTSNFNYSIALGVNSTTTANNQMVVGSNAQGISSVVLGHGVTDTGAAASVTISNTGGSGADKAGSDLILAGGRSTGAGTPGQVKLQMGLASGSSSTANTLTDQVILGTAGTLGVVAGSSTTFAKVGGTIFDGFADVGNTTTAETDLHTFTTLANTLNTNGQKLEWRSGGTFVGSTSTKDVKLYFGGTAIFDSGALAATATGAWSLRATIIRDSSSTIRYTVSMDATGLTTAVVLASVGKLTGLTLSSTNVIKTTGTAAASGAATNDIVEIMASVFWYPQA